MKRGRSTSAAAGVAKQRSAAGSPAPGEAYARIRAVVRRIPRGRVATYGQIAALAGYAHAPRLAGYAMYALPEGSPIPWHRVVAAGGRLSLAKINPEGALLQRLRLEAEGVMFDPRGRVRLERHGWGQGAARTTRRSPKRAGGAGPGRRSPKQPAGARPGRRSPKRALRAAR